MRKKLDYQLWKKYRRLQNLKFTGLLSLLLLGFLTGNLFGTILGKIRELVYWDGFIILFLVIFLEFVSYVAYSNKRLTFFKTETAPFINQNKEFWKFVNFFKIGIMIGFFVDAFKVGS